MLSRIRDVRKAKGLTLTDVAERCVPPTTAQTIGRLETGMRTLSLGWLNRIAAALGVDSAELVELPDQDAIPVAAVLRADGAQALDHPLTLPAPRITGNQIALRVETGLSDYRSGDEIWCERLETAAFGTAMNRDILAPRPGGRFLFGRMIGRDGGRVQILPLGSGARQQVLNDPPWIAVASRLIRRL